MVLSAARTQVRVNFVWYLAAGIGSGILAGFLGIGGGIVLVPVMVGVLGLNQHRAHATSLAVIIPIAMAGTIIYVLRGDINLITTIIIGAGSIAGVIIGARVMVIVSAHRLRQGFGVYAIVIAILLLLQQT